MKTLTIQIAPKKWLVLHDKKDLTWGFIIEKMKLAREDKDYEISDGIRKLLINNNFYIENKEKEDIIWWYSDNHSVVYF